MLPDLPFNSVINISAVINQPYFIPRANPITSFPSVACILFPIRLSSSNIGITGWTSNYRFRMPFFVLAKDSWTMLQQRCNAARNLKTATATYGAECLECDGLYDSCGFYFKIRRYCIILYLLCDILHAGLYWRIYKLLVGVIEWNDKFEMCADTFCSRAEMETEETCFWKPYYYLWIYKSLNFFKFRIKQLLFLVNSC